jgi:hypothetical protein
LVSASSTPLQGRHALAQTTASHPRPTSPAMSSARHARNLLALPLEVQRRLPPRRPVLRRRPALRRRFHSFLRVRNSRMRLNIDSPFWLRASTPLADSSPGLSTVPWHGGFAGGWDYSMRRSDLFPRLDRPRRSSIDGEGGDEHVPTGARRRRCDRRPAAGRWLGPGFLSGAPP